VGAAGEQAELCSTNVLPVLLLACCYHEVDQLAPYTRRIVRSVTPSSAAIWRQLRPASRNSIARARLNTAIGRPTGRPDFVP